VTKLLSRLCCCQNPEDDCGLIIGLLPGSRGPAPGPTWAGCNGRPAPGHQWACEESALDFPTVDCLVQDIKTCNVVGKEGTSHVFYSFGTDTESARLNVRDKLNGKGTMFNHGLMSDGPKSGGWAEKVLYNPRFDIGDPTRVVDPSKNSYRMARNNILVARYSEARLVLTKSFSSTRTTRTVGALTMASEGSTKSHWIQIREIRILLYQMLD